MVDSLYSMPFMPQFGFPNMMDSYTNQVGLNDTTGLNFFTPPYNSYSSMPFMDMDDSIFNCSPWGMPSQNYNFNYDNGDYYSKMMDNQVKYQQKTREADITLNSALRNMRQNGKTLHNKILSNEQEQIMPAFEAYVESAKSYYGDKGDYDDLKNTALEAYETQFGKSLEIELREHGDSSFLHGVKEVGFLGLGNKRSAEQNLAEITGQDEGKTQKNMKSLGNATAGAGLGLIGGFASSKVTSTKPILKNIFKGKSPKVWVAMGIGAIAGWIGGKILDNFA